MDQKLIRNFSIIAHIDHGKSTLADRLLMLTGAISEREFREQFLDDMDLERERGITIKARAVRMNYRAEDGKTYCLNLIDTPGHVDFSYEVAKSLRACEGALLLVDSTQGVEAQTVANLALAREQKLAIIPVINKIDMFRAEPEKVRRQITDILRLDGEKAILASGKEGTGVTEIVRRIVSDVQPPEGSPSLPLRALIFDSRYDNFRGVVVYIRVMEGVLRKGEAIRMMHTGKTYELQETGVFTPHPLTRDELGPGEVGYLIANIKAATEVLIGDTVTSARSPAKEKLPGYKEMKPLVFSGIYPVNSKDFPLLQDALLKLRLNDASFVYQPESSASLGYGFRCGFLGLLHMEIIYERLEREFDLNLITTIPSVAYRITKTDGEVIEVENPVHLPDPVRIRRMEEPCIKGFIISPAESVGAIMQLSQSRRGIYRSTEYVDENKVMVVYDLPLAEVLVDFYDRIKSLSRGYGSVDYEFTGYREAELVKLDILINGERFDAFSSIVHREKAESRGRMLTEKLKEVIPRQLFEVIIQAAIGSRIVARSRVKPVGKHVTSKCYGGDITRKRKLWEKQKVGKKRLKQFGKVEIPQEAFMEALKIQ